MITVIIEVLATAVPWANRRKTSTQFNSNGESDYGAISRETHTQLTYNRIDWRTKIFTVCHQHPFADPFLFFDINYLTRSRNLRLKWRKSVWFSKERRQKTITYKVDYLIIKSFESISFSFHSAIKIIETMKRQEKKEWRKFCLFFITSLAG